MTRNCKIMKIIHVSPVFDPYMSGISNVVHQQARYIASRGHDVSVLTPRYNRKWKSEEIIDGISVMRFNPIVQMGNAAFTPGMIYTMSSLLDGDAVVQLHLPFFGAYEWLWFFRKFGLLKNKKMVILYHHDPQLTGLTRLLGIPSKFVFKSLMGSSDAVIVSSADYAKNSDIAPIINNVNLKQIPFGVDTERFAPKEKKQIYKEEKYVEILFVGAMDKAHHFKGVDVLLRALSKIKFNDNNIARHKLKLVGDGDLLNEYVKMSKELGIDDRVEFAGFVSEGEKEICYANADLLVFPSTGKAEAFGMVALEGMSAGLPVIASDLPGVRSLIGRDDMLVEPGDVDALSRKISELINNHDERLIIGMQNRKRVLDRYSWEKVTDKLESLYCDLK